MAFLSNAQFHLVFKTVSRISLGHLMNCRFDDLLPHHLKIERSLKFQKRRVRERTIRGIALLQLVHQYESSKNEVTENASTKFRLYTHTQTNNDYFGKSVSVY